MQSRRFIIQCLTHLPTVRLQLQKVIEYPTRHQFLAVERLTRNGYEECDINMWLNLRHLLAQNLPGLSLALAGP